jgi:cell division protein FtsW
MQQGWLTKMFKGDRVIWALVVVFMIYSLLAVYSSSVSVAYLKHGGNTTYFLRSQLFMLLLSLVIIVIVSYLPYRIYYSLSGLILLFSVGLLILTFAIGARVNEAVRTIEIPGTGFRLQTSDVAKVALVLYLARALARFQGELNNFMLVTKYLMFPVAVICALIMPENLSTALMVFGISMIIMFIGRVPFKYLLAYLGIAVVGVVMFAMVLSMFSEKNRDFIFAIIIEEYGLLFGAIPLILAYMVLLFRGITIIKKCETAFPAFLVIGLIVMITVQAMLNMLVAVGLFPVTGQTLPMVSWGRTSVLVMSFSIGAILSVSRVVNARARKEELPEEEKIDEGEKIYEPAKA